MRGADLWGRVMRPGRKVAITDVNYSVTITVTRAECIALSKLQSYSGNIRKALKGFREMAPHIDTALDALYLYKDALDRESSFLKSLAGALAENDAAGKLVRDMEPVEKEGEK